jgi:hypothetical protein
VITITNRWSGNTIHEIDAPDLRSALEALAARDADLGDANLRGANLRDANLRDADLRGANLGGANLGDANLRDANLRDANLGGANLRDADLRGANLGGANLGDANLRDANLRDANLGGANLRDADLRGANLGGANLGDANLRDANLRDADLRMFRDDVWAVLSGAPAEAAAVLAALQGGRVNGSQYAGACACLVGTIANARSCAYDALPLVVPDARRPAEQWFLQIKEGDTPETSPVCKQTAAWVEGWIANMRAAFAA